MSHIFYPSVDPKKRLGWLLFFFVFGMGFGVLCWAGGLELFAIHIQQTLHTHAVKKIICKSSVV